MHVYQIHVQGRRVRKKNVVIPIVASIGALVVIAAIATRVFWIVKSKRNRKAKVLVYWGQKEEIYIFRSIEDDK